ncbi:MAG: hypothetical protein V4734_04130 [Terriglobus sp.]
MRLMIITALLASVMTVHPEDVSRKTTPSVAATPSKAILEHTPSVHLLVRGGTAQWSFQFVCIGAHCRFRHTRVPHRLRQPEYVNLAVRFSGVRDQQGDAAVWLQRVSAKKESAEGN